MRIKSVKAPKETNHYCACKEVVAHRRQRESKCMPLVDVHQDAASQIVRKHWRKSRPHFLSSCLDPSLLLPHLTILESSFKLSSDLDSRPFSLSQY